MIVAFWAIAPNFCTKCTGMPGITEAKKRAIPCARKAQWLIGAKNVYCDYIYAMAYFKALIKG